MTRLKTLLLGTIVAGALGFAGLASAQNGTAPAPQAVAAFTHPQTLEQDLARLDLALNNTGTLSGRFTQVTDNGAQSTGNVYLQRPGKIRFEYDAPVRLEIISDGVTVMQRDKGLDTSDRVPLRATPLHFFLKSDVQLARDARVVGLQKYSDATVVTVADPSGDVEGQLSLVFNEPNLALREWTVTDGFGVTTRIVLSDLRYNEELDPRLFLLRNERDDRRRR